MLTKIPKVEQEYILSHFLGYLTDRKEKLKEEYLHEVSIKRDVKNAQLMECIAIRTELIRTLSAQGVIQDD